MLLIRVHRVLTWPAVSVAFERDQAFDYAFPGVGPMHTTQLAYWSEQAWPHPGDCTDLADLVFRALERGEQRIGEWGGWESLV